MESVHTQGQEIGYNVRFARDGITAVVLELQRQQQVDQVLSTFANTANKAEAFLI